MTYVDICNTDKFRCLKAPYEKKHGVMSNVNVGAVDSFLYRRSILGRFSLEHSSRTRSFSGLWIDQPYFKEDEKRKGHTIKYG